MSDSVQDRVERSQTDEHIVLARSSGVVYQAAKLESKFNERIVQLKHFSMRVNYGDGMELDQLTTLTSSWSASRSARTSVKRSPPFGWFSRKTAV